MSDHLETRLKEYSASSVYPFHMPGHKRKMNPLDACAGFYEFDITEIDGFDNLHDPQDILRIEMERAARLWGAKETYFSVNGSTCALLAAISAAAPKGGRILIDRGCHMSVYHASCLRELDICYIEPGYEDADAVQMVPEGISAIVITSPSYEGVVRDIQLWADAAHSRGALLIVDEAHGAHFGFHPYFPESAVRLGADLVAQSTHKTLPALTQTALLHIASDRADRRRVKSFLDIYETSSPSYVLMASITSVIRLLTDHGGELFEAYAGRLMAVRKRLASLANFSLDGSGMPAKGTAPDKYRDPGKIVIRIASPGRPHLFEGKVLSPDGPWLYDLLRLNYGLQMEMSGPDFVLAMTSIADTAAALDALATAMEEIDSHMILLPAADPLRQEEASVYGANQKTPALAQDVLVSACGVNQKTPAPAQNDRASVRSADQKTPAPAQNDRASVCSADQLAAAVLPPRRMPVWLACESAREYIPLEAAEGRVAADFIILYPPDAPLIVPGEEFTKDLILKIWSYKSQGFSIIGLENDLIPCIPSM